MGLACDLELDNGVGSGEAHKWAWFRRYCMASRVLKALIERTPLPQGFCADVSRALIIFNYIYYLQQIFFVFIGLIVMVESQNHTGDLQFNNVFQKSVWLAKFLQRWFIVCHKVVSH